MAKIRSFWAVFVGFVSVAILSTITDFILEYLGIFPPITEGLFVTWMLVLATFYRSVYTVLGGYITARLAPGKPMKHVIILGIIGMFVALIGLIATWGKGLGPEWYPIALVVLSLPCVWLGGKLRELVMYK